MYFEVMQVLISHSIFFQYIYKGGRFIVIWNKIFHYLLSHILVFPIFLYFLHNLSSFVTLPKGFGPSRSFVLIKSDGDIRWLSLLLSVDAVFFMFVPFNICQGRLKYDWCVDGRENGETRRKIEKSAKWEEKQRNEENKEKRKIKW